MEHKLHLCTSLEHAAVTEHSAIKVRSSVATFGLQSHVTSHRAARTRRETLCYFKH